MDIVLVITNITLEKLNEAKEKYPEAKVKLFITDVKRDH